MRSEPAPQPLTTDQEIRIGSLCDAQAIGERHLLPVVRAGVYGTIRLEFNLQDGYVESVRAVGDERIYKIPRRAA